MGQWCVYQGGGGRAERQGGNRQERQDHPQGAGLLRDRTGEGIDQGAAVAGEHRARRNNGFPDCGGGEITYVWCIARESGVHSIHHGAHSALYRVGHADIWLVPLPQAREGSSTVTCRESYPAFPAICPQLRDFDQHFKMHPVVPEQLSFC